MKFTPPAGARPPPPSAGPSRRRRRRRRTSRPSPSTIPPARPACCRSSSDLHLPETELIEPLTIQPTLPATPAFGRARRGEAAGRSGRSDGRHPASRGPHAEAGTARPRSWRRPRTRAVAGRHEPRRGHADPRRAGVRGIGGTRADGAGLGAASRAAAAADVRSAPPDGGHASRRRDARDARWRPRRRANRTTTVVRSSTHGDTHPVPGRAARRRRAGRSALAVLARAVARPAAGR